MFKSLLTLFCFHFFFIYGQQDYEIGAQTTLDSPVMISLNRYLERYEKTSQLMQQAGFTNILRFNAIDGYFTTEDFFQKLNIHKNLRSGQKGCAASHLLLWKKFLKDDSDKEYLFVCEDDMLPHSNFSILFPLFWKAVPKDFDIFMIGYQGEVHEKQKEKLIVKVPSYATHAYIVSKKGAKKLLDLYKKIPKDSRAQNFIIDHFIKQMMEKQNIIYYCCNGINFPDFFNQKKIVKRRDKGICFQNHMFVSTVIPHRPLHALEQESKKNSAHPSYIDISNIDFKEFEQFLINSLKNKKVAYCVNPGNAGDSLIWYGTICLFKKLGISYIPYNLALKYDLLSNIDVIVYAGGGNLAPYYGACSKFLKKNIPMGKPILLLPHTIQGHQNLLKHLPSNVILCCREQMSYDYCKSIVAFKKNVNLAHDLAFFADLSFVKLKKESNPPKNLFAFRVDTEINPLRKKIILPSSNQDVSHYGSISEKSSYDVNYAVMKKFIETINAYDVVWTDRLHVGIAAFLLGKEVHLFDNSYGKNRAIFDHTIRHLDKCKRVVFHDSWDIDFSKFR
jgi:exopolysaccharide biosynthesis predicted pyruvyltransferase EpsI